MGQRVNVHFVKKRRRKNNTTISTNIFVVQQTYFLREGFAVDSQIRNMIFIKQYDYYQFPLLGCLGSRRKGGARG